MKTSGAQAERVLAGRFWWNRVRRGNGDLGSARGLRAIFGGSPKTLAKQSNPTEPERTGTRQGWVESFDGPSNGARQRRALPDPQYNARP